MYQSPIIVIVNKKPYTLRPTDIEAIRTMPAADRQQLISLLEVIRQQENQTQASTQQVVDRVSSPSYTATAVADAGNAPVHLNMSPERLRSGDVDALMAQLIMEENLNKKPALTKQSIHKWTAIVAVIVFFMVLVI